MNLNSTKQFDAIRAFASFCICFSSLLFRHNKRSQNTWYDEMIFGWLSFDIR